MKRQYLKNKADVTMLGMIQGTHVWETEKFLASLDRRNLGWMIEELRTGETMVRKLRQRLEALQSADIRLCPECGGPVAGRADAIYCNTRCRIRAHRKRND
jgi:hypothetical protein